MTSENKTMVITCVATVAILWGLTFIAGYHEKQKVQACLVQTGNSAHTIINGDLYCRTDAGHWIKNKEYR